MPNTRVINLIGLVILLFSCNPGQVAPPADPNIHEDLLRTYIHKSYSALTGREALPGEMEKYLKVFRESEFSRDSRKKFIESIQASSEFRQTLYKSTREYLLNFIYHPSFLPRTLEIWKQLPQTPERDAEIERLHGLENIPRDLDEGSLNECGLQRRLTHNSFYDFVNMGTENFVVSCYENFLLRFPTNAEREAGKLMVDGNESETFLKKGNCKSDFLNQLFASPAYWEGQVVLAFRKLLYRDPSSTEQDAFTRMMMEKKDQKILREEIMSGDEYAGLQPPPQEDTE